MFYKQTSTVRKVIELLVILLIAGFVDQVFSLNMVEWVFNPFFIIVLLFALRYGLVMGLASFLLTLGYYMIEMSLSGGDVFLLFYDPDNYVELLYILVVAVLGGLFSTSWKERYESLHYTYEETNDENIEMKEVIELLEQSQRSMQERVLESEYSLKRLYDVAKALDQPSPDLVRNEAIRLIADLFQSEEVALYHVDSSQHAMRLFVRKGSGDSFPQTIFIDRGSMMYQRLFAEKTITIRTVQDEEDAPVLAGPVLSNGTIKEVLIIRDLDFARLTNYEIQILSILLDWLADRLEKSHKAIMKEEEKWMYPGTGIYYKEAFDEKVHVQEKRSQTYGVPFSTLRMDFNETEDRSLLEVEVILRAYLREMDIIGYDEDNRQLLFLLPGTESSKSSIVEDRISKYLHEKGVRYAE
ncbi:hypothetical protein [Halobacillus salinus]|uniref:GAF domain-containing protein n=1 Tax=Halobacillus salinus TaxID=192814 RepID=A0A4Z0H1T2_9BACI|nr:hypothetical protein [Halobacillus salinus]TGB03817.1 hypothetical protein E4663_02065 [Halobacillus salinus]